jgi:hypothetical protein
MRAVALLLITLLLTGCTWVATPTPQLTWQLAQAQPQVSAWYVAHSAPAISLGRSPREVEALQRYRPSMVVDRHAAGFIVRLDSVLGPAPHHVDVIVQRGTGQVLAVNMGR